MMICLALAIALPPAAPAWMAALNAPATGLHAHEVAVVQGKRPSPCPNGRWLATAVLHEMPAEGPGSTGQIHQTLEVSGDGGRNWRDVGGHSFLAMNLPFEWSPGSDALWYTVEVGESGRYEAGLWKADLKRGTNLRVRLPGASAGALPVWSPSGRRYLVTVQSRRPVIYAVDRHTGRRKALAAGSHPRWSPDGRSILYVAPVGGPDGGREGLWLMRADGTGRKRLSGPPQDGAHAGWFGRRGWVLYAAPDAPGPPVSWLLDAHTGRRIRVPGVRAVDCAAGGRYAVVEDADRRAHVLAVGP